MGRIACDVEQQVLHFWARTLCRLLVLPLVGKRLENMMARASDAICMLQHVPQDFSRSRTAHDMSMEARTATIYTAWEPRRPSCEEAIDKPSAKDAQEPLS